MFFILQFMMKQTDRAIGYFSIAAFFLILGAIAFGMWRAQQNALERTYVDFPELGSLQTEDPVTDRGYEIGHVGKVEWLGNAARVEIIFDKPYVLREGTKFRDENFALMGQRRVDIIRSKEGKTVSGDHVFQGDFVPGLTEALGTLKSIADQAFAVRDLALAIARGTDSTPSVPAMFKSTLNKTDSVVTVLDNATRKAQPQINSLLHRTEQASYTVIAASDAADSTIGAIELKADSAIKAADKAIAQLSEAVAQADEITRNLETDSTTRDLLYTKNLVNQTDSLIAQLNALIKAINTKGITMYDEKGRKVDLITWKGMNLIGKTAREKARERAEKAKGK